MENTDWAYIAGLLDGEAYIGIQKLHLKGYYNPTYQVRICINMSTKEPLETLSKQLGISHKLKTRVPKQPNRQLVYRLAIDKRKGIELLENALPYLILKRRQAEICLEMERLKAKESPSRVHIGYPHFQPLPKSFVQKAESFYQEIQTLNSNKKAREKQR